MTQWFVVATIPRQEQRASENLARQGYSVFLPILKRTSRHARRTSIVLEAVFPGYLFVNFQLKSTPWRSINGTFGVRSLLMNGGRPAALPEGFCEKLQSQADSEGALEPPPPDVKIGDLMRFKTGPLSGHVATIVDLKPRQRVELLLVALSLDVRIGTSLRQLSPAF